MMTVASEKPTIVRYGVLTALAVGAILAYLLRASLAPAVTTIQGQLAISNVAMGDILAAFFLGYFWFQLPGGWVAQRFGARGSLALMGLLWAGTTVVCSFAHSGTVLYGARVFLGIAQAGLFPVTVMAIRDWFPPARRGLASSVITCCMSLGAVLANYFTTRLLLRLGWRETFWIYGFLAAAWAILYFAWFRNSPKSHSGVNQAELDLIQAESESPSATRNSPRTGDGPRLSTFTVMLAMLRSPAMWALNAQTFFQSFAYAVFITWFPKYLEKGRGLSLKEAGDLSTMPLFSVAIGSLIGGYLIDLILKKTGNKWLSRSVLPAVGLTVCALATAAAAFFNNSTVVVVLIALGMLFMGIAMPGKWACTIDLTAAYSALGLALMNMSGNVGAWISPKIVGQMFETFKQGSDWNAVWIAAATLGMSETFKQESDWNAFLYLIAIVELAGAFTCLILNPNKPAIRSDS